MKSAYSPAAGLFRVRATKPGRVIELDRHMLALMQSDAEIGQILMRAFILRRVELVAAGTGDVVLSGSAIRPVRFGLNSFSCATNTHTHS